jgi:hypothetical protein
MNRRVTTHTFPRSFATHLLENGKYSRTIQELLGLKDVKTTMIFMHGLNCGGRAVRSPRDGSLKTASTYKRGKYLDQSVGSNREENPGI